MSLRNYILENKNKKIELFRIIYTDSFEDIDFQNLGSHYSYDAEAISSYMETIFGKGLGYEQGGDIKFYITIEVTKNQINKEATIESNRNHPREKEIVINPNEEITVTEVNYEGESDFENLLDRPIKGNTGNNYDKWVEEFL